MTQQQLEVFKKEIYEPYKQVWELMASLRTKDLDSQTVWDEWYEKCIGFRNTHPNEYCYALYGVLIQADELAKKIWSGEIKDGSDDG